MEREAMPGNTEQASVRRVPFGVFLPVGNGGFIMSATSPRIPGTYDYNREVTRLAEDLGLGFVVSMARWRGWGGSTGQWNRTIESITTTAGLAEATDHIRLFMTIHTNAFHPAVAAKMVATIDEICGGRAGVNLVAGSNPLDHGQMGIYPDVPHAELYDIATEWITVAKRLWAEERVDFDGHYYHLTDCFSNPKPVQGADVPVLCAATSDTGMRFTTNHATATLMNGRDLDDLVASGVRAKQLATELNSSTQTVGLLMIVPGATDEEARARVDLYTEGADVEALYNRAWEFSQSAKEWGRDEAKAREARRMFAADNKTPLAITQNAAVGTPESIARQIADVVHDGDFDWIAMYFPDYIADLETFGKEVMPLLPQYGIEPTTGLPERVTAG
jgi:pyrimidine oxygenase